MVGVRYPQYVNMITVKLLVASRNGYVCFLREKRSENESQDSAAIASDWAAVDPKLKLQYTQKSHTVRSIIHTQVL